MKLNMYVNCEDKYILIYISHKKIYNTICMYFQEILREISALAKTMKFKNVNDISER